MKSCVWWASSMLYRNYNSINHRRASLAHSLVSFGARVHRIDRNNRASDVARVECAFAPFITLLNVWNSLAVIDFWPLKRFIVVRAFLKSVLSVYCSDIQSGISNRMPVVGLLTCQTGVCFHWLYSLSSKLKAPEWPRDIACIVTWGQQFSELWEFVGSACN